MIKFTFSIFVLGLLFYISIFNFSFKVNIHMFHMFHPISQEAPQPSQTKNIDTSGFFRHFPFRRGHKTKRDPPQASLGYCWGRQSEIQPETWCWAKLEDEITRSTLPRWHLATFWCGCCVLLRCIYNTSFISWPLNTSQADL